MLMVEADDQEKDWIAGGGEEMESRAQRKAHTLGRIQLTTSSISLGGKLDNTGSDTKKLVDLVVGR